MGTSSLKLYMFSNLCLYVEVEIFSTLFFKSLAAFFLNLFVILFFTSTLFFLYSSVAVHPRIKAALMLHSLKIAQHVTVKHSRCKKMIINSTKLYSFNDYNIQLNTFYKNMKVILKPTDMSRSRHTFNLFLVLYL